MGYAGIHLYEWLATLHLMRRPHKCTWDVRAAWRLYPDRGKGPSRLDGNSV